MEFKCAETNFRNRNVTHQLFNFSLAYRNKTTESFLMSNWNTYVGFDLNRNKVYLVSDNFSSNVLRFKILI